ncbi:MAG: rifampin ADP-ribosyl transferase [Gracilibacter sp. BRH_c7a]|nr:MAG: rifampin ADP-ribosyl transferase [Gracilibacter sp. BRH_c7a]
METTKKGHYVELPVFQGPLDLLLHLIQQHKVDIYDIPIVLIADQFIATVRQMEAFDLDVTSEFLVLAANLLYLKSRSLLPRPQKTQEEIELEEDLKQDLVERLVTYSAFKKIALFLNSKEVASGSKYFREIDPYEVISKMKQPNPLTGIDLDHLFQAFQSILSRVEKGEITQYIQTEEIPVEMMLDDIMRRLILYPAGMKFSQILRYRTRVEIVVAFVALLELLKDGRIRAEQSSMTNEIFLVPTAKAWDFVTE